MYTYDVKVETRQGRQVEVVYYVTDDLAHAAFLATPGTEMRSSTDAGQEVHVNGSFAFRKVGEWDVSYDPYPV